MESELIYNTPIFSKDKEYTECERCDGDGWIEMYEEKMTCPICNGTGKIEIND